MQPETQTKTQTPSPVDFLQAGEEGIINLIKEIINNPEKFKEEAKLLLKLSVWHRQGSGFIDEAFYQIIYGDADEIILEEWDSGYPYTKGEEIVLVPRSIPVVILHRVVEDYGELEICDTVYVFTNKGWVSVPIR